MYSSPRKSGQNHKFLASKSQADKFLARHFFGWLTPRLFLRIVPLVAVSLLVLASCSSQQDSTAPTTTPTTSATTSVTSSEASGPVVILDDTGEVTLSEIPDRIVSISPTATEMLFAIGAGSQVVAADSFSNYPESAPTTDLSGFTPNVEAISEFEPDLVVMSFDPGDVAANLQALGIDVLIYSAAPTLQDAFEQMENLGEATGHLEEAVAVTDSIKETIDEARQDAANRDPDSAAGTYYLELDPGLYSVTSDTFIGEVIEIAGFSNIADAAQDTAGGYPQLSAEFILEADPDFIFLTDCCDDTVETLAERPGWSELSAIQQGRVVIFSADLISRWGPRLVDLLNEVSSLSAGVG